ncbi:hypothetical protein [uncultured Brevundimonas sp.]|uniref:hypothetical protein n=1 Tax=uncultured Brevundimonas sp. TaxID=213418 RepID=UPI00261D5DFB|nr:hypothetical protein [uncultured Brevundimonas sp.]
MRTGFVLATALLVAGCQWIPGTEAHQIREAEGVVSRELRDPTSAQFRNVRVVDQVNGSRAFCGEVNGKNAYGGYVGFEPFVYGAGRVHIGQDDVDAIRAHTHHCVRQGRTEAEFDAHIAEIEARTARIRESLKG